MTLDIDVFAEELAEALGDTASHLPRKADDGHWDVRLAERIIANHLRAALPQWYAVHHVVDGVVCPDACGVVTVGRVGQ